MDLSPFAPGYDPVGRRARSLELYGLLESFRRSDRFGERLTEIARLAATHAGGQAASVDVWPGLAPVHLAGWPREGAVGVTSEPVRAAWQDHDRDGPPETRRSTPAAGSPVVVLAAPLTGHEGVTLGLLSVTARADASLPADAELLVTHLAGAVVHVLDHQRRLRRGRTPSPTRLRAVDAPDRRSEP